MPLASEADFAPEEDEGPRSDTAAVDLGALKPSGTGKSPSGRDLIAEAVESGVDLHKAKAPADVPDNLVLRRSKVGESDSAVDLGAPGAVVDSEHDVFAGAGEPTPSMMDRAGDLDLGSLQGVSAARLEEDDEPSAARDKDQPAPPPAKPGKAAKVDKPAKPPTPRSAAVGWIGGGAVGALAGASVCVALWFFGLAPGGDTAKPVPNKPNPNPNTGNVAPPATLESAVAELRNGDIDKALPILEAAGDEPQRVAARGEARWLIYLKQQKEKNAGPEAVDEPVKQAIADLEKAKDTSPQAFFWLGQIHEFTGNTKKARQIYEEGLNKFPDKKTKMRFQAAIDCLETKVAERPGGNAEAPAASDALVEARLLARMLTALQGDASAKEDEPDEAGYYFWSAAKLARTGQYAKAIEDLDKARALHDKQRYSRIRKAQNPESDPNEEIFLKSCTELKAYWEIAQVFKEKGYQRQANQTLAQLVGTTLDGAKAAGTKNGELTAENKQLTKDLDAEKKKSADELKAVKDDAVLTKTKLEKDLNDAKQLAKTSQDETKETLAKLKAIGARIEEAGIQTKDPVKGIDELVAARVDADAKMTEVGKKLEEAKFIAPKANSADILKGVERVVGLAKAKDPEGQLSAAKQELQRAQDALAQRRSPEEMLSVWLPVVNDRSHRDAADKALADAERVLKDDKASSAAKAQAKAVQALALRDQGKFDAARAALEQALKDGAKDAAWYALAQNAQKELTDPAVFYLARGEQLHAAGRYPAALGIVSQGLSAFPKDNGRLLALRAVVWLDQVRDKNKGKVSADDPAVAEIRKDAEAAVAAGAAAEGHYALGRLAEELGKLDDACQSYQHALDAKPDNRTRLALARVLMKAPPGRGGAERGKPDPAWAVRYASLEPTSLASAPRFALAAPTGREEADRLADEVLASAKDDPAGLVLKAQAYAIKGLWTKALTTYVEGLRPHLRGEDADALLDIIDRHPALKRPDSLKTPNPSAAAQHYSTGLRLFFERKYADAEKEFVSAAENDSLDARFFYFLGLSRLMLDHRDAAIADFEQAANLERLHRPDKATVNAALERVQGAARQEMNRYRP
jgi:tetratricopeptide (TPR) repeat protein